MIDMQGGIFLNHQTQVHQVKVRSRASRLKEPMQSSVSPAEIPCQASWGKKLLQADRLMRNLAVTGGLFLVVAAVRNVSLPEAQSVFGALQAGAGMEWDESVGKLSFVNSFLPESIQSVWNEHHDITVFAPVSGSVVHAWSQYEPYVLIETTAKEVRVCADGEVMSIAHGIDEERIVRVRHDDGTEAVYGNLHSSLPVTGDRVYAGDIIGTLLEGEPLAFELRVEGRSVNPEGRLKPFAE